MAAKEEPRGDGKCGTDDGGGNVEPEVLEVAGGDRGGNRSCGVHGSTGDRAGEEGFKTNGSADSEGDQNRGCTRGEGDLKDNEHKEEGEDHLEDEGVDGRTGREGRAEGRVIRIHDEDEERGGEGTDELGNDEAGAFEWAAFSAQNKGDADRGIDVRAGDRAKGGDHGHDDQSEGEGDTEVGDRTV